MNNCFARRNTELVVSYFIVHANQSRRSIPWRSWRGLVFTVRFSVSLTADALSSKIYRPQGSRVNVVDLKLNLRVGKRSCDRGFSCKSSPNFGSHGGYWQKTSHDRSDVPRARTSRLSLTRVDRAPRTRLFEIQETCLQFWITNMEKSTGCSPRAKIPHHWCDTPRERRDPEVYSPWSHELTRKISNSGTMWVQFILLETNLIYSVVYDSCGVFVNETISFFSFRSLSSRAMARP